MRMALTSVCLGRESIRGIEVCGARGESRYTSFQVAEVSERVSSMIGTGQGETEIPLHSRD